MTFPRLKAPEIPAPATKLGFHLVGYFSAVTRHLLQCSGRENKPPRYRLVDDFGERLQAVSSVPALVKQKLDIVGINVGELFAEVFFRTAHGSDHHAQVDTDRTHGLVGAQCTR
jgi:hypothetical protein